MPRQPTIETRSERQRLALLKPGGNHGGALHAASLIAHKPGCACAPRRQGSSAGKLNSIILVDKKRRLAAAVAAVGLTALAVLAAAALSASPRPGKNEPAATVLAGEARRGSLTMELPPAVEDVAITPAKGANRPLVVIDPGHGGRDPGAVSASGALLEKSIALTLAVELRDRLAARGRVRVALTRSDDRYLSLGQRATIARRLGADLFISLHADSAPNPLARGATVYSLSEVASDAEAARFARAQNGAEAALSSESDGSVRALLADLAMRDEMQGSAQVAARLLRKAAGRVLLRPEPHRFADFRVLRRAAAPAVLIEAGYLSNEEDEAVLASPRGRAGMVAALADTIETDLAIRRTR